MFDVASANLVDAPPRLSVHSETCGLALEHTGDHCCCDHFAELRFKLGKIGEVPPVPESVPVSYPRRSSRAQHGQQNSFCIIAPLAIPGPATVAALVFLFIWDEYFFAQLLTISFNNLNIQITLAEFQSAFQRDTTAELAGTTIAMLVPITAFLALQRYVVAGLTAGSSR
jgi:hypothetical protein